MKHVQRKSFRLNPIATAVALVLTAPFVPTAVQAGSGFGSGVTITNAPNAVPTYYANSPSGPVPVLANGVPTIRQDGSGLPIMGTTGTAMRKFVDPLQLFGAANANAAGQYIPVAVPQKWVNMEGQTTADDYYEIAAVEYSQQLHSDLPKATHLRGYVQLETTANAATSKHIALTYPNGTAITDPARVSATNPTGQVYAYDNPHHLGPVINATSGTAVRVKFSNYLPAGSSFFLPVDPTLGGAGLGPDGVTSYTQNRAGMHLMGGQAPWVSAGTPHQWVAPAGEAAAYAAGIGKGASTQNVPDMPDPGPGAMTLYFPNQMSGRFTFIRDETLGIARLNTYAGLEAAYRVSDPIEQTLVNGGTLSGGGLAAPVTVAAGTLPAAELPLVFEDKTFVPANVAQQDALWDTTKWGVPGDLWFPHVYETNQDPTQANGTNPVGRWDYGPLFWPIFQVSPDKGTLPSPSFVPEAYLDTLLVNGTAYPTVTVEPKAYRVRLANASTDRFINLGFYLADGTVAAPVLDANGNPVLNAAGVQQTRANTEMKMIPAAAIDAAGDPPGWDVTNGVQLPLPQFGSTFPWHINYAMSGPTRAWATDARIGGVPDPTTSGPDFIQIGTDGGFLPGGVDIPSQPITYEQNRRSVTVTNIYGYGMLLGPGERADTVVDFTNFAGKTLILYNDAPTPTPFLDQRDDYFTGDPDQTSLGGTYTTQPGYGPNTRTVMQVVVGSTVSSGGPLNAGALAAAIPAAYAASQPAPLVTQSFYNTPFGTSNPDVFARVATGSAAQPNLSFSQTGSVALTGFEIVSSGGAGTGSGSGFVTAPSVTLTGGGGTGAMAHSVLGTGGIVATGTIDALGQTVTLSANPVLPLVVGTSVVGGGFPTGTVISNVTGTASFTTNFASTTPGAANVTLNIDCSVSQVCSVVLDSPGTGYSSAPTVTFASTNGIGGVTVVDPGAGYLATDQVVFTGGGGTGASAKLAVTTSSSLSTTPAAWTGGSGYTVAPNVTFQPAPGSAAPSLAATATTTITSSTLVLGSAGVNLTLGGSGYTSAATASVSAPQVAGTAATAAPVIAFPVAPITVPAAGIASASGIPFDGPTPPNGNGGGTTQIVFSAPQLPGGSLPQASVSVDPVLGVVTAITFSSFGSGYTSAPTATIIDLASNNPATGGTGTPVTVSLATTGGVIAGVNIVTAGSGYTAPATITFKDATGTGASATAAVLGANGVASYTPVGVVNSFVITGGGRGYTAAPSVVFTEPAGYPAPATVGGADATASVGLTSVVGAITGISMVSYGTGYTSAPSVNVSSATGTGANLSAGLIVSGVGAQAYTLTSTTKSYPVLTKAEQELFDDYGRYNSTGGIELPYTTSSIQTTIPLNYNDAATEVIGDGEVQIWKIVDNGFWSNSMHFNGANVQLVNRVGWDGTVKAPATNEAGWKDTLRLNPLEDMIVAVQGVRAPVPFGQPRSTRLQDPSTPANTPSHPAAPAAGVPGTTYVPGLGFTADPGVVQQAGLFAANPATVPVGGTAVPVNTQLLTTTVNTNVLPASPTGNYDNEFMWGTAVMGHATDDLQRPLVFNPLVNTPAAPQNLADTLGTGTLTWTDTTPNLTLSGAAIDATGKIVTVASTAGLVAGPTVSGAGFPAGTTIAAVTSATTFTTSAAAAVVAGAATGTTGPGATGATLGVSTLANTQNEIAFQVLQAPVTNVNAGSYGAFTPLVAPANTAVTVPANSTAYAEPAALVSPTPPNGQYYAYEVVAYNAAGVSTASNVVVEAPPAAPTSGVAQGIPLLTPGYIAGAVTTSDVNMKVQWQDNAINETNFLVTRTGGTGATPTVVNGVTTAVTGGATATVTLPPNTQPISSNTIYNDAGPLVEGAWYEYDIVAQNAFGKSAPVLVGTVQAPISVPLAPTGLKATVAVAAPCPVDAVTGVAVPSQCKPDNVVLTWTDAAFNETSYTITRTGGPAGTTFATVTLAGTANNAGATMTWTDTTVQEGFTYSYVVSANNTSISGAVQTASATTSATVTPTAPTLPTNVKAAPSTLVSATGTYLDTVALSWSDNAYNETAYQVYRDGVAVGTQIVGAGAANNPMGTATAGWKSSPVLTYTDGLAGDLADGSTHSWYVQAINGTGTTNSATVSANMPGIIIAAPSNVRATPNRAGSSIGLSWTDNSTNETDFLVEESVSTTGGAPGSFSNWTVSGTVARTAAQTTATGGTVNFNRANVPTTPGYVYTFRISARNLANKSDSHPYAYAQASLLSPAVPTAPTLAVPTVSATGRVTLTWNAIAPATGTTMSYLVFANGVQIAATNGVTYRYTPVAGTLTTAPGVTYTVEAVATAIRGANQTAYGSSTSVASNAQTVLIGTPAAPSAPATLTVTANALNWTAPATVVAGATVTYVVQQSINGGAWTTLTAAPIAARTLAVTSTVGNSYQYRVQAYQTELGLTSAASAWTTTTYNTLPVQSTVPVLTLTSTRNYSVSWTNTSNNITGWTVQRGLRAANGTVTWTTVAPTITHTGTTYSFTNVVTAAGTYSYRVLATSAGGSTAYVTSNAVATN